MVDRASAGPLMEMASIRIAVCRGGPDIELFEVFFPTFPHAYSKNSFHGQDVT